MIYVQHYYQKDVFYYHSNLCLTSVNKTNVRVDRGAIKSISMTMSNLDRFVGFMVFPHECK